MPNKILFRPLTRGITRGVVGFGGGGAVPFPPATKEELFDLGARMVMVYGQSLSLGSTGASDVETTVSTEVDHALMFNGGTRPHNDDLSVSTGNLGSTMLNGDPTSGFVYLAESVTPRADKNFGETISTGIAVQNATTPLFFVNHGIGAQTLSQLSYQGGVGNSGQIFASQAIALQRAKEIYDARGVAISWPWLVLAQGEADVSGSNTSYDTDLSAFIADVNKFSLAALGDVVAQPKILQYQPLQSNDLGVVATAMIDYQGTNNYYLAGPCYQYDDVGDGTHLTSESYRRLGEYLGHKMKQIEADSEWRPLYITSAVRSGAVITLTYNNPTGSALVFDTTRIAAQDNQGFEIGGNSVNISDVSIINNTTVEVTMATPGPCTLLYGVSTSTLDKRGNLRDSESAVSAYNGEELSNWACKQSVVVA